MKAKEKSGKRLPKQQTAREKERKIDHLLQRWVWGGVTLESKAW